jgi:hypothetical protein
LYANYAFAAIWLLDVVWWWCRSESHRRRAQALHWVVHIFLGFIAFNATVIFGVGAIRWFGVAASICIAALLAYDFCHRRNAKRSTLNR